MNRVALGATLVLAALTACSDSNGPDDGRCEEAVNIVVTPGTSPTITWAPACTVAQLRVAKAVDGEDMWAVLSSTNSINPGVEYGQTPAGATTTRLPAPLLPGTEYRVILSVFDPESNELLVAATRLFTP